MKKIFSILISALLIPMTMHAQGWPANYEGVMLQGFYWDSYDDSAWSLLEKRSDEMSKYFSLVWIPQSGNCGGTSMGYNPLYYYDQNSTFGTEAELKSMIAAFKKKGTGVIADVVVNHRGNLSTWVDFPKETNPLDGKTYEMLSTDICKNDDGGETAKHTNGLSLSPNNDEGEDWGGMRDLDHKSDNVQNCVKAYVKYLVDYLGYTGFRYDMVKGFHGSHVKDYNQYAGVEYSVGECWDNNSTIENWIEKTERNSAAFDFQFRYNVRDAINKSNWTELGSTNNMNHDSNYRRYAVTFVENHDTEYRSADYQQDPIRKDTLAANAWLLANPGTPCVFYKHWLDYKKEIKQMIEARKLAGITSQSDYENIGTYSTRYVRKIKGTKGDLIVACGTTVDRVNIPDGFKEILSGYHYRFFTNADTSTWQATLDRIQSESEAVEEESFDTPAAGYKFTAYFLAPSDWTKSIRCWAWDTYNDNINYTGGSWPGEKCYKIGKAEDGRYIWQWCYYGNLTNAPSHIIFNNSGSPQTGDMTFTNGGWYQATSLAAEEGLGIEDVPASASDENGVIYNLAGQKVQESYKGIIIKNGRKYLNK